MSSARARDSPRCHELVARPERTVEEEDVGVVERLAFERSAGRRVDDEAIAVTDPERHVVLRRPGNEPREMHRRFPRHGASLDARAIPQQGRPPELEALPRELLGEPVEGAHQRVSLLEPRPHGVGGPHFERGRFPQREETEDVIEIRRS